RRCTGSARSARRRTPARERTFTRSRRGAGRSSPRRGVWRGVWRWSRRGGGWQCRAPPRPPPGPPAGAAGDGRDAPRARGIRDEAVLAAMAELPRHIFVDEALAHRAYEDMSLPLGFGQTISSPHTVARMTELARAGSGLEKVLEIGTGCGYQTAVLAKLVR